MKKYNQQKKSKLARALVTNKLRASRDPFYLANAAGSYLSNSKHSKAWSSYGYTPVLEFAFFYDMYSRIGLAYSGVSKPVDLCWQDHPRVAVGEEEDDNQTPEEEEFKKFCKRIRLWKHMKAVDEMQRVGRYAGFIWTIKDGKDPKEPLEAEAFTYESVVKVTPVWEAQLIPGTLEQDKTDERYGLPNYYTYQQAEKGNNSEKELQSYEVHHTRITLFVEGALGDSIYGRSCLEHPFNALLDWEKVRGAGGEGLWRAAAQRLVLKSEDGEMPDDEDVEEINQMVKDMFSGMDEVPGIGGYDLEPLQTNMPDSKSPAQIALEDVAAGFKMPVKVLIGAQTGVKAGDEDGNDYRQSMQTRRNTTLTYFVEDVLTFLTGIGVMPEQDWNVFWDDLTAPTKEQKLDNAAKMKTINGIEPESVFSHDEIRVEAGLEPRTSAEKAEFDVDDDEFDEVQEDGDVSSN